MIVGGGGQFNVPNRKQKGPVAIATGPLKL
jgi:hypothetical protein